MHPGTAGVGGRAPGTAACGSEGSFVSLESNNNHHNNNAYRVAIVLEMGTRRTYRYEIQRWRKSRDVGAEEQDRTPYWPHSLLDHTTKERVRDTKEQYLVNFQTTKGKHYRRELPESEWMALDDQVAYHLRVTLYGRVTRYGQPRPMLTHPQT